MQTYYVVDSESGELIRDYEKAKEIDNFLKDHFTGKTTIVTRSAKEQQTVEAEGLFYMLDKNVLISDEIRKKLNEQYNVELIPEELLQKDNSSTENTH